jgi:3-hydroxyisobutyrate dehydrogenase-like beta-hydroxyacid dehydrogenase
MDIGFIGLGGMGRAMARNLLKAGHRVSAYNRTSARAEELKAEGASVATTPAAAARSGIVITMVADDAALETVTNGNDGILAGLPAGGIHLSMSTIGAATAEAMARAHEAQGRIFVSAPVFGRPAAAAEAKLFIVASGDSAAIEKARPALEAMSQRIFTIGDRPEQATLVKLLGNFLITCVIESLGEVVAVGGKAGIAAEQLIEVYTSTLFSAPVYKVYGGLIAEDSYSPPGFTLPLGLKDNRLVLQAAEKLAAPMPFASVVRDRLLAAIAAGWSDLDWASFARIAAREAGLKVK